MNKYVWTCSCRPRVTVDECLVSEVLVRFDHRQGCTRWEDAGAALVLRVPLEPANG